MTAMDSADQQRLRHDRDALTLHMNRVRQAESPRRSSKFAVLAAQLQEGKLQERKWQKTSAK
jgi:hypothetical protein